MILEATTLVYKVITQTPVINILRRVRPMWPVLLFIKFKGISLLEMSG